MKVYVEGWDDDVFQMFFNRGHQITSKEGDADLICLTGGADISPSIYGCLPHRKTGSRSIRDTACLNLWQDWGGKKPFAGICRGGQFLNAVNGGKMWQHVDGHGGLSFHEVYTPDKKITFEVNSWHHQMMIPNLEMGKILLSTRVSTRREYDDDDALNVHPELDDVEAVIYPQTKSFCYQPHPEMVDEKHPCQEFFFKAINHMMKG